MKWEEAETIVETFAKMDFMAPPTSGLIPIGKEQIDKGMREILTPEFISSITRKPKPSEVGFHLWWRRVFLTVEIQEEWWESREKLK